MTHSCLNCNQPLLDKYCHNCGQKSSTHRYSLKHFIEHDIIHGIWHVDKGLFFTIKELFVRPGHSVREYIQGKRVRFFNFVSLIILVVAVGGFLAHYSHIKLSELMPRDSEKLTNSMEKFATDYPKIVVILTIPIYAFGSFMWFRKSKLNFTEHLVLNSYKSAAELIIGTLFTILTIFYTDLKVLAYLYWVVIVIGSFIYPTIFYYQFFSKYDYSKSALLSKAIMIPVSYLVFTSIIVGIVKICGGL